MMSLVLIERGRVFRFRAVFGVLYEPFLAHRYWAGLWILTKRVVLTIVATFPETRAE